MEFMYATPFQNGSNAVTTRFGTCPTGMRATSFNDVVSMTDREAEAAFDT
jgi:hypothetical protein